MLSLFFSKDDILKKLKKESEAVCVPSFDLSTWYDNIGCKNFSKFSFRGNFQCDTKKTNELIGQKRTFLRDARMFSNTFRFNEYLIARNCNSSGEQ